jgi:hypothetical protein
MVAAQFRAHQTALGTAPRASGADLGADHHVHLYHSLPDSIVDWRSYLVNYSHGLPAIAARCNQGTSPPARLPWRGLSQPSPLHTVRVERNAAEPNDNSGADDKLRSQVQRLAEEETMPVTFYPEQVPHQLQEERKWSYLIKIPGVRSGMRIPVSCRLINCEYRLITPRRVRIQAEIDLSTHELQLQQPEGPKVRWKGRLDSIPAASAVVTISHILTIGKDKPGILRLEDFQAEARVEQTTTMRDRLVVKGSLAMRGNYTARIQ